MLKIEPTTKESYPALVLRGEFETDVVDAFIAAIDELRAGGSARIMVSLRYVKYVNSTALGAIVRARGACNESGGDLVILQPSRLTREIIEKMGLASVLNVFDDEAKAADFLDGDASAEPSSAPTEGEDAADEQVSVTFSFDDDRSQLIPGKSKRHGVAVLQSVDPSHIVFHWDPAKHDSDAATASALFPVGSRIHNKVRLKIIRKEFFEADSEIESSSLNDSGIAVVKSRWTSLSPADRDALANHEREIQYLREQAAANAQR